MNATERKPRLTAKVLDGLVSMASEIEAGEFMSPGGDLEEDAPAVTAAIRWVNAMRAYRAARQGSRGTPA